MSIFLSDKPFNACLCNDSKIRKRVISAGTLSSQHLTSNTRELFTFFPIIVIMMRPYPLSIPKYVQEDLYLLLFNI